VFIYHNIRAITFHLLLFIIVVIRVYFGVYTKREAGNGINLVVDGVLINYPKTNGRFQSFNLKNCRIIASRFPKYSVGEYLSITTKRDRTDARNCVVKWGNIKKIQSLNDNLLLFMSAKRDQLISRVNILLPMPYSSLVLGMVFGINQKLPDSLYNKMYNGGILHVIVASGYNVSVILSITFFFFRYFNKYINIVTSIVVLILYLLFSGLNPPLIRASIMGIINLISKSFGYYIDPFVLLVFTINIMLIVNPYYIKSVGFWLSIIAIFSLICFSKIKKSKKSIDNSVFYNGVFESVFVNIYLFPVIAYFFGSISVGGVIANPLVLWMVPFVIVLSIFYIIFGNNILRFLLIYSIDAFLIVVSIVGSYINIIKTNITLTITILIYLILVLITFYLISKYNEKQI